MLGCMYLFMLEVLFFFLTYIPRSVIAGSLCFPGSSAGEESTCNAGDPGSIPGLGRSPGEVMGYPVQYSWASLVAQRAKNLPTRHRL